MLNKLVDAQDQQLTSFLSAVLRDHKEGVISDKSAINGLAHFISAVRDNEPTEVSSWLKEGRKFMQEDTLIDIKRKSL
ncbi:TPA: hypothetical protein MO340_004299 [Salmonella enterica subsp. salamae serovar 35:g,m,s,t:-]|nr:hypothetical protein [Salmonella enterica subsp. salamae serovar 35:g,m,s,t:-]HCA3549769.1 hypothetical protein [Salmonella enterica subsp. salamae serovar 35:g,m,s,t:-]